MEKLPISVIIVAKNAERTIEECLEKIRRNDPVEIIIIDGDSTDRTVEIARKFTRRIYSDGGKGLAYARQLGAEMATQQYIAYIDADIILMDKTLETMLNEFQNSCYVSIRAQEDPMGESFNYWEWARLQQQISRPGKHLSTACGLFQREIILKYGFDQSAGHLDDIDLEFKLKKKGYDFGTSSALFYYQPDSGLASLTHRAFLYGRWKPRAIQRYGPYHAGFWPPLVTNYWLVFCLRRRKFKLIPYFVVEGVIETLGMITGWFELIGECSAWRRNNAK